MRFLPSVSCLAVAAALALPTPAPAAIGHITGLAATPLVEPADSTNTITFTVDGTGVCDAITLSIDGKAVASDSGNLPFTFRIGIGPGYLVPGVDKVTVSAAPDCPGSGAVNVAIGNLSALMDVFKPTIQSVKIDRGAPYAYQDLDVVVAGNETKQTGAARCGYKIVITQPGGNLHFQAGYDTFGTKIEAVKPLPPGTYRVAAVPIDLSTATTVKPCMGSAASDFTVYPQNQ